MNLCYAKQAYHFKKFVAYSTCIVEYWIMTPVNSAVIIMDGQSIAGLPIVWHGVSTV